MTYEYFFGLYFLVVARGPHDETALSKGIIYPAAYLGSTQLVTTKQPTKKVRMQQAQEAVNRIKVNILYHSVMASLLVCLSVCLCVCLPFNLYKFVSTCF